MNRIRLSMCLLVGWALFSTAGSYFSEAAAQEASEDYSVIPTAELFLLEGSPDRPFRQPTDVAVCPKDLIYVMDGLNSRVAVFSNSGDYQFSFGSPGSGLGQMDMPVGIGISPSGNVYVADSGNHRIQIFGPKGKFIRAFPLKTGDKADPTDVLPSRLKNYCYVIDNDNHQVQVVDATTGRHIKSWGRHGKNIGEFRYPATIASDGHNHIYVVDVMNSRVQTFDPYGDEAREISGWGVKLGKVFRPKGVALSEDERIFISDSYMETIQVFRSRGDLFGVIGDKGGDIRRFTTPTNIVLDKNDRLYVVETRANRVTVLQLEK